MRGGLCIGVTALLTVAVVFLLADTAGAQPTMTGRSVGLSGSSALGLRGIETVGWNPAMLGLKDGPQASYLLPSTALMFGNNAFSPDYVSSKFVEGKRLSEEDKNDIISKMTAERLNVFTRGNIPAMGFSYRNYAFNLFDFHFVSKTSIPDDIFRLILHGNNPDETYLFNDVEHTSLMFWSIGLSAGRDLSPPPYFSEFSVGGTFKFIRGAAFSSLGRKDAIFRIVDGKIDSHGVFEHLGSTSGDGVGVDLGAVGKVTGTGVLVGLSLGNLIGGLTWNNVHVNVYEFKLLEGIQADSVADKDFWERFFDDKDSTYTIGSHRSELPRYLILSAAVPKCCWGGGGDLFFSYYQGLNSTPGQSTIPKFSFGHSIATPLNLTINNGLSFGGLVGFEISAGVGVAFSNYQLNIAGAWQKGLFGNARGFSLAFSNHIILAGD